MINLGLAIIIAVASYALIRYVIFPLVIISFVATTIGKLLWKFKREAFKYGKPNTNIN